MLVVDDTVAWVGSDEAAAGHAPSADEVVDLDGALVTPAFVDAHVHLTETGLAKAGLDLHDATVTGRRAAPGRGRCPSGRRSSHPGHRLGRAVLARRQGTDPAELDRASLRGSVYLARVDVHSAVVSSSLAAQPPACVAWTAGTTPGGSSGKRTTWHGTRPAPRITPAQREDLQRAALQAAAAAGIGSRARDVRPAHRYGRGPALPGRAERAGGPAPGPGVPR